MRDRHTLVTQKMVIICVLRVAIHAATMRGARQKGQRKQSIVWRKGLYGHVKSARLPLRILHVLLVTKQHQKLLTKTRIGTGTFDVEIVNTHVVQNVSKKTSPPVKYRPTTMVGPP